MKLPDKIKLMADYQCWCLWDMDDPNNIDPNTLPLSKELTDKLMSWSAAFDQTLDLEDHTNIGFDTEEEYQDFYDTGWVIFDALKAELPSVEFWYKDRRHAGFLQCRPSDFEA